MNKLFQGIPNDSSNVDIGWIRNKAPFYNEGYKTAARELSTDYEKRDTRESSTLIFPIIFLYRHYIELTLKDLIKEIDSKLNFQRNDKILDKHTLLPLWKEAINQYEKYILENNVLVFTSPIKEERSIVEQFDKIDSGSFSFRYPTDKKGNDCLKEFNYGNSNNFISVDNYISVNNFKAQIEIVITYLDRMIDTMCDYT
jgi:hypothetical protein